jgi:uncharacterized protein (TIGR03000 family)
MFVRNDVKETTMPSIFTRERFRLAGLALLLAAAPAAAQQAPQPDALPAVLHVRLPADAELTVDGKKTRQTGPLRHFFSPPLLPGKSYHYTFVWSFRKDGKPITLKKIVNVRAGDDLPVNLLDEKGDDKKTTKPPKDPDDAGDKPTNKKPVKAPELVFVPPPSEILEKMLETADIKKSDVVYNLGCGDGRIVLAAAKKYECKAYGFDNDEKNVRAAEKKVADQKLDKRVTIKKQDIFEVDLTPASVVLIYLSPEANSKLVPQLEKLKPGSRIVSYDFKIEDYKPDRDDKVIIGDSTHHVYLWETPLKKK